MITEGMRVAFRTKHFKDGKHLPTTIDDPAGTLRQGTVSRVDPRTDGINPCPCCGMGVGVRPDGCEGVSYGYAPADVLPLGSS